MRLGSLELKRPATFLQGELEGLLLGSYLADHMLEFAQENEASAELYRLLDSGNFRSCPVVPALDFVKGIRQIRLLYPRLFNPCLGTALLSDQRLEGGLFFRQHRLRRLCPLVQVSQAQRQ